MPTESIQVQKIALPPKSSEKPNLVSPLPDSIVAPQAETPLTRYYTTANLRLRTGPSKSHSIVRTLAKGSSLRSLAYQGTWINVITIDGANGWVHKDYVSTKIPITQPQVARTTQSKTRGNTPIRAPMTGKCDCPYDRAKNGSRCGSRSAYSRPGGRSPVCYK